MQAARERVKSLESKLATTLESRRLHQLELVSIPKKIKQLLNEIEKLHARSAEVKQTLEDEATRANRFEKTIVKATEALTLTKKEAHLQKQIKVLKEKAASDTTTK